MFSRREPRRLRPDQNRSSNSAARAPTLDPGGREDLHTTAITSNLKYMTDDPTIADNQIFSAAVGAASVLVKQFM